jgi:uncharacterized repeat protein (TIGR02543 family)
VTGHNGRVNPTSSITRAETVALLDRIRTGSRVYGFAGTYGPEEGTEVVEGDLTIAVPGVSLQNLSVAKDLTVAAGVGTGTASLSHVAVGGRLYVEGGQDSLTLADVRAEGDLVVRKAEGDVRIVVSGASDLGTVRLESGATLVTQNLAAGTTLRAEIAADAPAGSAFAFDGTFDSIVNNGKDTPIAVTGTVGKLTLNAPAQVTGTGRIAAAEVLAGAGKGTTFATAPASLTGDGKGDVTLPTVTAPSGGGGGGGGGTPSTPTTYTITFQANDHDVTGLPDPLIVTRNTAATRPTTNPALDGHTFVGWYRDAEFKAPYDWSALVTASFTLYARFEDPLTAAELALTFDSIRGSNT